LTSPFIPTTTSPLTIITDDMHEVDHVIAQRLTSSVPLVAQISQ
jgi:octaprenyl-diphosphate synthase